jgi:hypothetical protein
MTDVQELRNVADRFVMGLLDDSVSTLSGPAVKKVSLSGAEGCPRTLFGSDGSFIQQPFCCQVSNFIQTTARHRRYPLEALAKRARPRPQLGLGGRGGAETR